MICIMFIIIFNTKLKNLTQVKFQTFIDILRCGLYSCVVGSYAEFINMFVIIQGKWLPSISELECRGRGKKKTVNR